MIAARRIIPTHTELQKKQEERILIAGLSYKQQ